MSRPRTPAQHVTFRVLPFTVALLAAALSASVLDDGIAWVEWRVVVNNGMTVPNDPRTFNSYNHGDDAGDRKGRMASMSQ